ncbi:MAG: ATP synthase F1 subunit gamma [Bacteroidia bacterium]|nr:ATP synthase F1 subunit gamma [Bacteroidia bacterium]MCF8427228.1 ATP synthase F1 subunit gamma [Bacteroidia bacterium]MCF8446426.1 ATP synthase F1 subunit gamma [Bacteroidia bacterium]
MANLKEVRIRITSVNSTQQITKAMKLVSATKLRRAQNAIVQMRPYAQKLNGILANLSDSMDVDSLKVYFNQRPINKVLLVVITSDRGLCGGFNANVIKLATRLMKEDFAGKEVTILPVGKKAFEFFTRANASIIPDFKDTFQQLNAENGFSIGEYVLNQFKAGKFDKVELVYNQFKNAATQILVNEPFLPIAKQNMDANASKNDYIFEPGKAEILETLIPRILKTQVYKGLLDSFASEHGARMIAMDKATDNAGELIKALKLEYNRARQSAITTEISEIVGGAAALSGS